MIIDAWDKFQGECILEHLIFGEVALFELLLGIEGFPTGSIRWRNKKSKNIFLEKKKKSEHFSITSIM